MRQLPSKSASSAKRVIYSRSGAASTALSFQLLIIKRPANGALVKIRLI